jgi:hypothetical protein
MVIDDFRDDGGPRCGLRIQKVGKVYRTTLCSTEYLDQKRLHGPWHYLAKGLCADGVGLAILRLEGVDLGIDASRSLPKTVGDVCTVKLGGLRLSEPIIKDRALAGERRGDKGLSEGESEPTCVSVSASASPPPEEGCACSSSGDRANTWCGIVSGALPSPNLAPASLWVTCPDKVVMLVAGLDSPPPTSTTTTPPPPSPPPPPPYSSPC